MIAIAPYYKAVTAGVGSVVGAVTGIVPLLTLVQGTFRPVAIGASVLIGIAGIAQPLYVFLVRNEPLATDLDSAISQLGPVVHQVERTAETVRVRPDPGERTAAP